MIDVVLAADILAQFFEEAVTSQRGGVVTFNLQKIEKWYTRKPTSELLTKDVKYYIRRYVERLYKMGVLGKGGGKYILRSDLPLWAAARASRARVYLANVLQVPELPLDAEKEAVWKRRLRALVERARRAGVDGKWISKVCALMSADEEGADVRAKVAQIVEEVEEEIRRGFDLAEAQSLYLRLVDAVELLAQRFDKEAARRVCWAFEKVANIITTAASPRKR